MPNRGYYGLSLLLFASGLSADSKLELQQQAVIADLKAKLTASEAARAAATRDKANDKAAIGAKIDKYESRRAAASKLATAERETASATAEQNVNIATAVNEAVAKQAASVAATVALRASEAAGAVKAQNEVLIVTQIVGFFTLIAGFAYKWAADVRDHKWSLKKIAEVKEEAHAAYEISNTVNDKIASIGMTMKDGSQLKPEETP